MIKGIKGVKDILPEETPRWQTIEAAARRQAELYGFHEIRVPIFEVTELFARSIGASTDIVEKEMYTFQDRDGTSLTLRPEATAGAVRAYIEHNLTASPAQQKLYYIGPMFRHERPQAGRLRQFHQFGVESFGSTHPYADIEVITLLWRFLVLLGLPGLSLQINSLGEAADRLLYKAKLVEFLKTCEDRLCGNCRRRLSANPLRVLDCKVPDCREATRDAPRLTDYLSRTASEHFEAVQRGLQSLAIPFVVNPRLVRGLDYYTMTAFEVTCEHLGAQNAVGAGGRYDGLVQTLGGPATPAVGFAIGLERVSLALPESVVLPRVRLLFIAGFGSAGFPVAMTLMDALRQRGVPTDTDYRSSSLKGLLRQADRLGATHVVIVGDDEVARGSLILRDMLTRAQEEVSLSAAADRIGREFSRSA